jgi:hypothetical protein
MAFAAARMILKDKRRKSKEEYAPPQRTRSKVIFVLNYSQWFDMKFHHCKFILFFYKIYV